MLNSAAQKTPQTLENRAFSDNLGGIEIIRSMIGIPEMYEINGLVAVYNLTENANVLIAASPRRSAKETLTLI